MHKEIDAKTFFFCRHCMYVICSSNIQYYSYYGHLFHTFLLFLLFILEITGPQKIVHKPNIILVVCHNGSTILNINHLSEAEHKHEHSVLKHIYLLSGPIWMRSILTLNLKFLSLVIFMEAKGNTQKVICSSQSLCDQGYKNNPTHKAQSF